VDFLLYIHLPFLFQGYFQLFRQISTLYYVQPDDVQAYEQDDEIIHSRENGDILILEPDIDYPRYGEIELEGCHKQEQHGNQKNSFLEVIPEV